jgi:FkbM family methyltransferase
MKILKYIYIADVILKTYYPPVKTAIKVKLNGYPVSVKLKNGERSQINSINDIIRDYLKVKYNLNLIYDDTWTDPYAVFIDNDYKWLPVKGKIVLDVGANIGDSSLYFLLKGADKVIAVEPFSHYYNILVQNIEENNFQDKIIPINAIMGNEVRRVKMNENKEMTTGIQAELSNNGKEIDMINLDHIINSYNIKNGALKMDCEGCEYDSILTSNDETLRHFEYIMLEYHYGYDSLFKKLKEAGYKVKSTRPKPSYNRCAKNPHMLLGYIFAKRIDKQW